MIDDIAKKGGNGISNGVGFYNYSKEESQKWEKTFERFSFDINKLLDIKCKDFCKIISHFCIVIFFISIESEKNYFFVVTNNIYFHHY